MGTIRLACATFVISETCCRYERRLSDANVAIVLAFARDG